MPPVMSLNDVAPDTGTAPTGWQPGALRPRLVRWTLILLGSIAVIITLANSSSDVSGTRIARPADAPVLEHREFLGISNWYMYFQLLALVGFVAMWSVGIYKSVKRRKPTAMLIILATITAVSVWDPIINWAGYTAYDPRFFHFNIDWFYLRVEPSVQAWVAVIAYAGFFLLPAWFVLALYKRLARRAPGGSFITRRPRLTLLMMALPICIIFDGLAEASMVRAGLYTFTQLMPIGVISAGQPWQFPLLWEPLTFGTFIGITAPLMWENDQRQSWGEAFAARFKVFNGRPHIGAFVCSFAAFTIVYFGVWFSVWGFFRVTGMATSLVRTWDIPETSVYDPQGFYQTAGNPGPFYKGWHPGVEKDLRPSGGG